MAQITFGKEEYDDISALKAFREGVEIRLSTLEKEKIDKENEIALLKKDIESLRRIIAAMAKNGRKVFNLTISFVAMIGYAGYTISGWLLKAGNWEAVTNFLGNIRSK